MIQIVLRIFSPTLAFRLMMSAGPASSTSQINHCEWEASLAHSLAVRGEGAVSAQPPSAAAVCTKRAGHWKWSASLAHTLAVDEAELWAWMGAFRLFVFHSFQAG